MDLSDTQVQEAMEKLGVTVHDLHHVQLAPSVEEGSKRLEELKARVKSGFRKAVFELHPDRTGNDQSKTELFMHVKAVAEQIERLTLRPRVLAPEPCVRVGKDGSLRIRFTIRSRR